MSLPVDSLDMWEATAGLPEQMATALTTALATAGDPWGPGWTGRPGGPGPITNVVVCGMGGSGIAGDVLAAVAGPELPVPVTVLKSYELPAFVGPDSLVFAVSCSGETEETLATATAAAEVGAPVVAVTGGGRLARLAEREGWPVFAVPAEIPQPRAALGAMAVPLLVVLEQVGLADGLSSRLAATADALARRRDRLVQPGSEAEELARRIGRTIPLVYGATGPAAVAAQRWKTQINENAKAPAFWSALPELCHNEVAGWGQGGDVTRQVLTLVSLRHRGEHPQVARRFQLVTEVLLEVVAEVLEVRAEGADPLGQLFDLILLGDFVSLHLAGREGTDPGPVPVLVDLKDRLRQG
ncbi:MAG TPA: bifunctional phosphoglucose/phosphomannose isomerase [Acidimicrobiales bacterium]|jgi:glucose/mannose-6-phosphate isomerase|nr:bifunctional phosphoglucose/phosphomannose isomerase [Acidimicrobiales bacterium]